MKTCFKCFELKPLSEFYAHPRMADGHLNKCKECTKKDTYERIARKKMDPDWVDLEMERQRVKQRQYREQGKSTFHNPITKKQWIWKNPDKRKAHLAVQKALKDGTLVKHNCEVCGNPTVDAHHDDYTKPLVVRWLCKRHHADHHIEERKLLRINQSATANQHTSAIA